MSTLESGFKKLRIRPPDSPDTVWTEVVSGKKKLRIKKYRDTCGWGLNQSNSHNLSFEILFSAGRTRRHSTRIGNLRLCNSLPPCPMYDWLLDCKFVGSMACKNFVNLNGWECPLLSNLENIIDCCTAKCS